MRSGRNRLLWFACRPVAVLALTVLGLAGIVAGNAAQLPGRPLVAGARPRQSCHRVPQLTGLTLANARVLAARAGCRIRVAGAPVLNLAGEHVQAPGGQAVRRIARQVPPPGRGGRSINVWLVPECEERQLPGPPPGEPLLTAGPTALVTGIYLVGGPLEFRPGRCRPGVPVGGTITVIGAVSGATVASAAVADGRLATIPLAPGAYTIEGSIPDPSDPTTAPPVSPGPQTVTITAGMTVRQDSTYILSSSGGGANG